MIDRRIEYVALVTTAVLARALLPDAAFFGRDQVGILVEGRGVLRGELFPSGPQIGWTPFTLGPLFEWLTALALIPRDEFGDVILMVSVIHGLAILGWRRLFENVAEDRSSKVAALAAWALALHPVSISNGGAPLSSAIVMPTVLVFFAGLVAWIRDRSTTGFAIACLGAALMIQAHITTMFLLPVALVGLWRRAPIGRIGIAGIVGAMIVASPMVIPNLMRAELEQFRHAGFEGAPFLVALARAVMLEGRFAQVNASLSTPWFGLAQLASIAWAGALLSGVVVALRGRRESIGRYLLLLGFVAGTVGVILIPRGALLLYLEATTALRAWVFATGVCGLAALARGRWSRAVGVGAGIAMAILAIFILAHRAAVGGLGYARVDLSAMDLREPLGRPRELVSIMTVGSSKAIGRALGDLGADPLSLELSWRGPWRWAGVYTSGIWIPSARDLDVATIHEGQRRVQEALARDAFDDEHSVLVLHADDESPLPATEPLVAGRFRIYPFANRLRMTARDERGFTAAIGGSRPAVAQVVIVPSMSIESFEAAGTELRPARISSGSGFAVSSIELKDAGQVRVVLGGTPPSTLQVRSSADAYAFDAAAGDR